MSKIESNTFKFINHVFKILNGTCPSYLSEHFYKVSDLHMYNTRGSSENFVVLHVSQPSSSMALKIGIHYLQTLRVYTISIDLNLSKKIFEFSNATYGG